LLANLPSSCRCTMPTDAIDYQKLVFGYRRSSDQDASAPVRHPVVVVGAGPIGLAAAIDLASNDVPVVLLDDDDRLSTGSRAICFSKRTLEIADRLGLGQRLVDKGVTWNTGKVFLRDELLYSFDLLPEAGHRRPAFINLQQYYLEGYLLDRARDLANLEIRWKNKVTAVEQDDGGVRLTVGTPDGSYRLDCDWLIAADGGRSPTRRALGLESHGQTFRDRFLIADVRMTADFPAERWFWFDPKFHPKQSVLLHQQPDNVWRIDFQLGWDADPDLERQPDRVIPRVRALLGSDVPFELEWVSIYTFGCQRMDRFRHGRVLFAGDSAHGVSPFGARGANSGLQDADNLVWKLRFVLQGLAPESLLDTYDSERVAAADENILNSTRSTDFITPKSDASRAFRDATLELARDCPFARRLVNSGRLSVATAYPTSPLNTRDCDAFVGGLPPGAPAIDAPLLSGGQPRWFLELCDGRFLLLLFSDAGVKSQSGTNSVPVLTECKVPLQMACIAPAAAGVVDSLEDAEGLLAKRYDGKPGTVYLFRPDGHVAARWRSFDQKRILAALDRALGKVEAGS
jgi:3-(3-hydroxy-phenyl)propionate hydroxylase